MLFKLKNGKYSRTRYPLLENSPNSYTFGIDIVVSWDKVFNIKAKNFADFIAQLAHSGYLYSFKHRGLHITVNTLTELKQAEKDINNFN